MGPGGAMTKFRSGPVADPIATLLAEDPGKSPEQIVADRVTALHLRMQSEGVGSGSPPFDPALYAQALGIEIYRKSSPELPFEAALLRQRDGRLYIFVNTARSNRARQRFSIAHELAHAMMPFACERPQYRRQRGGDPLAALERLADHGAAMLLMPSELFGADLVDLGLSPTTLVELSRVYGVSLEAAAVSAVKFSREPCAVCFCAYQPRPSVSRVALAQEPKRWRITRAFRSAGFPFCLYKGKSFAAESAVAQAAVAGWELSRPESLRSRGWRSFATRVTARPLANRRSSRPRLLAVIELDAALR